MVPDSSRRKLLRALAAAGAAGVAGCTSATGSDGEPTRSPTTAETTTAEPTAQSTTESTTTQAGSDTPTAPVEAFIGAEDVETFQAPFHPLHPFHPDNLSQEDAENLFESSSDPENVTVERVERDVTVELVESATLPGSDVETAAIEDALAGADTAVVEATVETDAETETVQFVTISDGDGWLILAQGVPSTEQMAVSTLDIRVVAGVAFEPDADAARVQFVEEPVADSVTVEATSSGETATSNSPGSETYLQVGLNPAGDEVVVRATLDGESRVVHRERYPESDRIVDEVTFDENPDDSRDAAARVTFDTAGETGRIRVSSTVYGGEAEAEPVESINYLVVGIDPDGDEVVVTYPVDGDTEEVHRERYDPQ